ncbi:glycoside hydrolase family 3 N-terminal domain-containing protein [Robertkochia solimangrovi]|uniref:glycoside hydrolase family 3 N-terminal domain-containing protein n=1 Tax=Robertkochia solimangrovi TaxID=2213046 RepID=UPI001180BEFD|nr:glycoside hydrolase family 3 N-terminal domain-containing protein [Robertkochia solimangrovi]TRZ44464.1 beta-glucosidase [Robertkochia solimangrovi]
MKHYAKFLAVVMVMFSLKTLTAQETKPMSKAEIAAKAEEILSKMTMEEKVGQMTQVTLDVIGKGDNRYSSFEPFSLDPALLKKAISEYHVGSFLNTANNRAFPRQKWFDVINEIAEVNTKESRLNIPIIYGVDMIHGATYTADATMFPQQIAQAAARNPEMVKRGAEITAYETRASGISWNFSPVLDLGIDPRFSRMWESFGEDPYLASVLGVAMIDGYEGEDNNIADPNHLASCMKHFLGYHAVTSGKDRTPSYIPEDVLREYHLPSFKAAIEAGSHTIMINSGIINGIPVHANYNLLTKLLKEELGFEGLVVTDWADIENLHRRDRVAESDKEAIKMAINAGIDMSMVPYQYEVFVDNLKELVTEGSVSESRIDDAVRRILKVKIALGLFEVPVTNYKNYPEFGSKAFEKASYDMAAEAITLLKNENDILPLKKGVKVLVTGPNANSMRTLNGAWTYSWQGEKTPEFAERYNTILEAVQKKIGKSDVTYVPGVSYVDGGQYYEQKEDRMDAAVKAAEKSDIVILCLGENTYTEKPGDLNDLYINDLQTELALKIAATGKPVVLVLNEGRPRVISKFEREMDAIVQAYLPGNFGGDAIVDILYGDVNPSGKLPYTYPRYPNATIPYIHKPSEEQKKAEGVYNYEADFNPQFPFGFGLSYTTFEYSDLKIDKSQVGGDGSISVSVSVKNTGKMAGKEVVELYTSDLYASQITPDVKRLRRFEKVSLSPGEQRTVTFDLKVSDLAYIGRDNKSVVEAGDFEIMIKDLKQTLTVVD